MTAAINLPLSQLRARYAELPTDREIWIYCGVGQRAYFASRFLAQRGYQTRNLSGGHSTYLAFQGARLVPKAALRSIGRLVYACPSS